MSNKNRNKYHNYNNYNKNYNKPETVVENIEDVVEETTQNATVDEDPNEIYSYGVVANCEKLNMRSKPSKQADVVCILTKGDKVKVRRCQAAFHEVTFGDFKGFCMQEFIELK